MNGPESEAFTFVVLHRAAPQGSKVMETGKNGKPFMRESSKGVRPFRTALKRAALGNDGLPRAKFRGPVAVSIEFEFVRPKSNDDEHATTANTVGDVDKLARAVLDGLTEAQVIEDDRFVVKLDASKAWGDQDRAIITVAPIYTHLEFSDGTQRFVRPIGSDEIEQMRYDALMPPDPINQEPPFRVPRISNPFDF